MMSNIHLLLIINFVFFLCYGMCIPVLLRHVMRNGGNHIIICSMHSFAYMTEHMTPDFLALFSHGKKNSLNTSLSLCCAIALAMVFFNGLKQTCVLRCLHVLCARVQKTSKELIKRLEPEHDHIQIFNLLDIMKIAGLTVGSPLGGYIILCKPEFSFLMLISSCLTFICILLLQKVSEDDLGLPQHEPRLTSLPTTCWQSLKKLQEIEFKEQWDSFVLKTVYLCAFAIYFSSLDYLLSFNYMIGSVGLGYTIAFGNIVIFVSNYVVHFVNNKATNTKLVLEQSMFICGLSLAGLYFAPSYRYHLILLVPTLFSYAMINSLFEHEILSLQSGGDVDENSETLKVLINIVAPICFGIMCHFFGGSSFVILTMLPVATIVYIINQHYFRPKRQAD